MPRPLLVLIAGLAFTTTAAAAGLARDARIGVVDALAPRLSAGFGPALEQPLAPSVRDDWRLGAIVREAAVTRLDELGYRASASELPRALADTVRRGGAVDTGMSSVRLDARFARELGQWMRSQQLDGVLVLRTLPHALAAGAPAQGGHGIAPRGQASVAYANLAPLLLSNAAAPTIAAAPTCLVTATLEREQLANPRTLADLAPVAPVLEQVLRSAVDGALIRAGVMSGTAACE